MKPSDRLKTAAELAMEGTGPEKKTSQTEAPQIVQTEQQALSAQAQEKAKKGIDKYYEAMANPKCKRCHGTGLDGKVRVYEGGQARKGAKYKLEDRACRCIKVVEVTVGKKKEEPEKNLINFKKEKKNVS